MQPLVCYVVTSLENRAREELAVRDVERLRAAGAFGTGAGVGESGGGGACGAGAGEGADKGAAGAGAGADEGGAAAAGEDEGRGARACVLVAAKPMAAAEELVAQLPDAVPAHIFDARLHLSFAEHVMLALSKRYAFFARVFAGKLKAVLEREARALLGRARESLAADGGESPEFSRIVFLEAHDEYLTHVFSAAELPVDVLVHEGLPDELGAMRQAQRLLGFEATRIPGLPVRDAQLSEEARASALDGALSATLLGRRAWLDEAGFHFSGSIALKGTRGLEAPDSLRLETVEGIVLAQADPALWRAQSASAAPAGPAAATPAAPAAGTLAFTMPFAFTLDAEQAENLPLDTKLVVAFEAGGLAGRSFIRYCRRDFGKRGTGRVGKVLVDETSGIACFFCQTVANLCQLVSRKADLADTPAVHRRIRLAWLVSKLRPARHEIVLWEKFSSRYEESARRVYEYMVDEGDGRVRFVLDGQVRDRDIRAGRIAPAYQGQIVERCSFAHYRLLFSAKTFISTEALSHLSGMHPSSRLVRRRMQDGSFDYVFLQHGPSYTVTLGSAGMSFFTSTGAKGTRRVVVSSELEKEHFVQSGGYRPEQLYVCGMPKYDANTWDADADLIAVMPTWRPWEEGEARVDFTRTSYHRFLVRVCEAVPEELRPKLRVLVHPRFQGYALASDSPLAPYMTGDTPYDEILRRVKLLITDHSSITFDAFYRGANVIFDWTELDECMQAYGQGTHLMLTDELAFGEVYRGEGGQDGLRALVEKAYTSGQSDEHSRRYRQIVEFHDGKNTERLMALMRADGLI